jgi:FtsZ-interacting cell division protein ZipA
MDPKVWIIIAVVVIAVIVIGLIVSRKRRTEALQHRFGPEYERALREKGDRAEADLLQRQKRVEKFSIRELSAAERERFVTDWRLVQSRFVDDPKGSVRDADELVTRLMQTRGYPMSDFEQRAADLSVDHPRVVDNYRAAHEVALRHQRGQATTEDLRNAIIYYRSLFDELLIKPAETREVA